MVNKFILKEVEKLQQKLNDSISLTEKLSQEREKVEKEYALAKEKQAKQAIRLAKTKNSQILKIDKLNSAIEDLELKHRVASEELQELELSKKEDTFELSKLTAETLQLIKAKEKMIKNLKEELSAAKQELREEKALDLELEKSHRNAMKKMSQEYKQKLENAKKTFSERLKKAEEKFNAKAQPLLFRVECLDSEIEDMENQLLTKPNELEALKKKYEKLNQKYAKLNNNRLLRESKLIMRSLGEALEFFLKLPEKVTEDGTLGVLLASTNLQWIYDKLKYCLNGRSWVTEQLELLLSLCHDIIDIGNSRNFALLNESLWMSAAVNLKYGLLSQYEEEFLVPEFDSCQSIDEYMMRGTPRDSDFCINELLTSKCNVSEYCWLSEFSGGPHSGYKTSHRLLYFQVAFQMKCEEVNSKRFSGVREMKNKLCQQMFLEASALFRKPSISLTRDLFMEQIGLCGLEGYEEFARRVWRNQVRTWQSFKGCFGVDRNFGTCSPQMAPKNNSTTLIKRTDSVVDDCHTHVTAVAISALAFFLRVTLKMAFNLP